jgi:ABC-type glycerol-3-phosphate transport system substrate-binding protein
MKKIIALLLASLLALSFTACSVKESSQSPSPSVSESAPTSTSSQETDAPVFQDLELSWYKSYDWYSAEHWANEKSGEIWIKDNYGIQINFQDSGGDANQKLATMILDNTYPDVISLDRDANLQKLITSGVAVPLDPYLDKYPNMRKYLGDDLINMLRADDGKLYVYPNWAAPIGQLSGNAGWMIQDKFYNELGKPEIKNYDQLYDYLKQLKDAYPDIIPLGLSPRFESSSVIYGGMKAGSNPGYLGEHLYSDNGVLKSSLEDPAFQETLLFVNKLYRERLISQDIFTMTDDAFQESVRNGLIGVACLKDIFDTSSVVEPNLELRAEDESYNLSPIDPVAKAGEDVSKVYTNSTNSTGWNVNIITRDAKDPEKIFALLDWWFGNVGQLTTTLGAPGKFWIAGEYSEEGYPTMTDEYFNSTNEEIDSEWCDTNFVGNTAFVDNMARFIYESVGYAQQLKLDQFNYTWNHSVDCTELTYVTPNLDTDVGILFQTIDNIYAQAIPEIITSSSEEKASDAITKYIATLKDAGLQELLDYQSGIVNTNLQRLGKK